MGSSGVILPAFDAAAHVASVIGEIRRVDPALRVLVVDDGSRDATSAAARAAGAEVTRHPVNRGKGAALATGFAWAVAEGLEWVYTMDADGQHPPAEMAGLREEAGRGGWDVVVGNRMGAAGNMPWLRKRTNEFTSWVVSRMAGVRIPDSQNGYRLFRVSCLRGLRLRTTRYDTESEILVRLARRGCRIGAAPVSTIYGDERSSIRPLVDTCRFFRLVAVLSASRRESSGHDHA